MMTDERMGDALWPALARLPRGAGVVFRHYSLPDGLRRALFARIDRVARRRGLVLVRAGSTPFRGEDGVHNQRAPRHRGLRTRAAHNASEVVAARRRGVDAILISPVFQTRSHRGARALGVVQAVALARMAPGKAIALGGVDARRYARLRSGGFIGYAAIDAWTAPVLRAKMPSERQKRSAVPT
jgi:thiamine-phosphate pyrophosphorylase